MDKQRAIRGRLQLAVAMLLAVVSTSLQIVASSVACNSSTQVARHLKLNIYRVFSNVPEPLCVGNLDDLHRSVNLDSYEHFLLHLKGCRPIRKFIHFEIFRNKTHARLREIKSALLDHKSPPLFDKYIDEVSARQPGPRCSPLSSL